MNYRLIKKSICGLMLASISVCATVSIAMIWSEAARDSVTLNNCLGTSLVVTLASVLFVAVMTLMTLEE